MIQIYGSARSSSGRCYWMLEELGIPYEPVAINMREKEHKSPKYLELNPNGKVPCLKDGDFVIWESMAINSYLAEKYNSPLRGNTPEDRGLIAQWSFWSILELQKPLIDIFIQMIFVPEERRDAALIEKQKNACPLLFIILDRALEGKKFLVGDQFSLADLNVMSVVVIADAIQMDLSAFKNINQWLRNCKDRPAYHKFAALQEAK